MFGLLSGAKLIPLRPGLTFRIPRNLPILGTLIIRHDRGSQLSLVASPHQLLTATAELNCVSPPRPMSQEGVRQEKGAGWQRADCRDWGARELGQLGNL